MWGNLKRWGWPLVQQDYERAVGHATIAMQLLEQGRVPPYPQFYELLYTYATGISPALNHRVNEVLRSETPFEEVAESLYHQFIRSQSPSERITEMTERVSQRIEAMHVAVDDAMDSASAYSSKLADVASGLAKPLQNQALRAISARLLGETQRMQAVNEKLETQLQTSREDIAQLQRDLEEVRRESRLDPLTRVANRKTFDDTLATAVAAAQQSHDSLCLMLVDIDHFKRFNDSWGHQTGDQVLRLVATILKSSISDEDLAARYGGEEFAVVLPSIDLGRANMIAEAAREAIQAKELLKRSTSEKLGRVTASFGIARLESGDTPTSLIDRADRCLYAAKNGGRNLVVTQTELADTAAA